MKKIAILFISILSCLILFASCTCSHENLQKIDNTATCSLGGMHLTYCPDCNYHEVSITAAVDHDFSGEGGKCLYCPLYNPDGCEHNFAFVKLVATTPENPDSSPIGSIGTNIIPGVITVGGTCEEDGISELYECTLCKTPKEVPTENKGHDFKPTGNKKEPHCREDGWEEYRCSICSSTEERVIPALAHQYTESEKCPCGYILPSNCLHHEYVLTESVYENCLEGGSAIETCKLCGTENTVPLPPREHGEVIIELFTGERHCKICGSEVELPHDDVDGELCEHPERDVLERRDPTCEDDGEIVSFCPICGTGAKERIPSTGHEFDPETHACKCGLKDEAYCTHSETETEDKYFFCSFGIRTTECTECNHSESELLPPKRCVFETVESSFKLCEGLSATFRCTECGSTSTMENVIIHYYADGTECQRCKAPSPEHCNHEIKDEYFSDNCEDVILKSSVCKLCDTVVKTEQLHDSEHTAALNESESHSATCTECGLQVYTCTLCGNEVYRVITAPKRHSYGADGKCVDCEE